MMLILDAAQADSLRGPTGPMSALDPVALASGVEWVLPLEVLDDPHNAGRYDELAALPQRDVGLTEFPSAPERNPSP